MNALARIAASVLSCLLAASAFAESATSPASAEEAQSKLDGKVYMEASVARMGLDMCQFADKKVAREAQDAFVDWLKPRLDSVRRVQSAPDFKKCPVAHCTMATDPLAPMSKPGKQPAVPSWLQITEAEATPECRKVIEFLRKPTAPPATDIEPAAAAMPTNATR